MNEATRLLRDLVRIPSVNPMGRSLSGAEYLEYRVTAYLEEFFRGLDVRYERHTVASQRDNIIAWHAAGRDRPTIMFEAHQDTVPAEKMTIEPFGGLIENGRLYGRGSCDIKGGMASMLAAFARLIREKPSGAANVIMTCAVDEEFTFTGITDVVRRGIRPDMAIVAEPTNLHIVHAHKGAVRWHLRTAGRSCHSSSPEQGVNAIYRMGRLLTGIEHYANELRSGPVDPLLGPRTLSVGRIDGGISVNTVPDDCRIEIDRRVVCDEDPTLAPKDLENYLRTVAGIEFPFTNDPPWMCKPALTPKGSEPVVRRLGAAINTVRGAHRVMAVPYGTDAASLAEAGIPSVVFGPGDIAKAHTADEWVPLDEVEQASEILYRVGAKE